MQEIPGAADSASVAIGLPLKQKVFLRVDIGQWR